MIGDPHSQLVPTSPIWSQLDPTGTKQSGSQLPRSWCIQNPRDLQLLLLPTFQNYDVVLAMVGANTRAKNKQNCTMICTIHGNCQCWLMVCGPHNPAGQGKNHGPAPTVFPAWETETVQKLWVLWHSGGMHCVQQNLKPKQAPSRCWDSMPQVDSGSCKLHGRHNENWWLTALSTCIRGLTGQSVA